jgi:hypothetical protein
MIRLRIGRVLLLPYALVMLAATVAAQNVTFPPVPLDPYNAKLAFTTDERTLHIIGHKDQHVRAITYNAATGAILHTVNLPPGTQVVSITSDGRTAIVATSISADHMRFSVLDTESGETEDIPATWYDPNDEAEAAISGDGRLISIYSESGTDEKPLVVSVYAWPARTLIARQTSEYTNAGGGFGGGITVDGKAVEFISSRSGSTLVELKTGRPMASFGPDSVRSPDGRWVVELPSQSLDADSSPPQILISNGADGKTHGKIDARIAEDEENGQLTGAFCGVTGRFILAGGHRLEAYAIPSGKLLATFPLNTWRDPNAGDPGSISVACSSTGKRVAVLSGTRLTLHDLK